MHKSKIYKVWSGMVSRCRNSAHHAWKDYGGRGIKVCERWTLFENFFMDMGDRPTPHHQIDRYPDQNGNYEKSNCRWATTIEQGRNRRSNKMVTFHGRTRCVSEWSEYLGIPESTLYGRLLRGWSIKKAFKIPHVRRVTKSRNLTSHSTQTF